MQQKLAVIGGSGLFAIQGLGDVVEHLPATPYGDPSAPVLEGRIGNGSVLFLSRHGRGRHLPPHAINYRANLWALKALGTSGVVAINVVGGISPGMAPGSWVVPDQIIDYTWGREHSIYDASCNQTEHVDFTGPYDSSLSADLVAAAEADGLAVLATGTYGCTQGPRLESAAEIKRLERDGCDIVGMTAMPEAALARELAIPYSSLCLVVNWAAGCAGPTISFDDMQAVVTQKMPQAVALLARLVD